LALAVLAAAAAGGQAAEGELLAPETPISGAIDHYIQARLEADGIVAAGPADEWNLLRRTTLDLAGRIPTSAEVQLYLDSTSAEKRDQLVDALLSSPDFAYHQRNEIDALLLARKKTDQEWRAYLLAAVRENRSWDRLFREMMTGDKEPAAEKQVSLEFLRARAGTLDDMTNDTSALFFGVSINCAKCHDHPLVEDWKQSHYYGMASFFSRTYLTKKNTMAEKSTGVVTYKTTSGEQLTAKFMFLTGAVLEEPKIEISPEQREAEAAEVKKQKSDPKAPAPKRPAFSLRDQLVELALKPENNHFFSRAIVNRLWLRLMGRGMVDPPDQMHSENPPSHPQLLDWLARDLVAHQYDLKRLIRGIVLSQSYARSSRWEGDGDPPGDEYFAVAQSRPLTPYQYALSLWIASANPTGLENNLSAPEWAAQRETLENAVVGFAGRMQLPGPNFQVGVDEALLLSNNEQIQNDFLRLADEKLVGHLSKTEDETVLVKQAFRALLSRDPDNAELDRFRNYLRERQDRRTAGIQQIVWALLTGPEMRFNY
jgi:hypothetical protein